jgi:hypothetical protein
MGELLADVVHARDESVVDSVDGREARGYGFLRQAGGRIGCTVDDALAHGAE